MLRRLSAAAISTAVLLAVRLAGGVPAAPAPACEITARVLEIGRTRHVSRFRPSEPIDYYRVKLELRGSSSGRRERSRSCDDSYLKTVRQRDYQILTLKEYARTPVKKGQEIKARLALGGDESFGGFFLSDIRIVDSGGRRKAPAYLACGCGCCGGVEPVRRCLYHSRGDDLNKIIEEDRAAKGNPACAMMGCGRGIEHAWCD